MKNLDQESVNTILEDLFYNRLRLTPETLKDIFPSPSGFIRMRPRGIKISNMKTIYDTEDYKIVCFSDETVNNLVAEHLSNESLSRKVLMVIGPTAMISDETFDLCANSFNIVFYDAKTPSTAEAFAHQIHDTIIRPHNWVPVAGITKVQIKTN